MPLVVRLPWAVVATLKEQMDTVLLYSLPCPLLPLHLLRLQKCLKDGTTLLRVRLVALLLRPLFHLLRPNKRLPVLKQHRV